MTVYLGYASNAYGGFLDGNAINVQASPFNAVADGVTDNAAAFAAAYAAAPVGSTIYVPPAPLSYVLSSFPTVDKTVRWLGGITALDNVGVHSYPVLEYTGAGVFISVNVPGATGAILEGLAINNTGTGTVGIDIDNTGEIRLLNVACIRPDVAFSTAGIRVGHTANTTDILLRDCSFWSSAPVGLRAEQVSASIVLDHSRFLEHSTNNVLLGTATQDVLDFQAVNGSTFEQTAGLDSVYVQFAKLVRFDGCYFENGTTGFALNLPATADIAEAVTVDGCWFTGLSGTAGSAINSAFAFGDLTAIANHYVGFTTSFIKNSGRRKIFCAGNFTSDASIPTVNDTTGVTEFSGWNGGSAIPATINGSLSLTALGSGGGLVSVGAADSGGSGFRLLRVPN